MTNVFLSESTYRREIRMFRGELTDVAPHGPKKDRPKGQGWTRSLRTTAGCQWYRVKMVEGLWLYVDTQNMYLKGFRNDTHTFRFKTVGGPDPAVGNLVGATELQFLESYNSNEGIKGLGRPQSTVTKVTCDDLWYAFESMRSAGFADKGVDEQRDDVAKCVIAIIEAARFLDVEDQVARGLDITDRSWTKHGDPSKVFVGAPE